MDEIRNIYKEDPSYMLPTKYRFIWPSCFRKDWNVKS